MVDKIVTLENNKNYVLLDEVELNSTKYYLGLRLNDKEEPTNHYLFFEETKEGSDTFLAPIEDDDEKKLLVTAFTVNFLDKVYDEV